MIKIFFSFVVAIFLLMFIPQTVFGIDIKATPEKKIFGPNDWLSINLEVKGYQGGDVDWVITKPDGVKESGVFSNFKASKGVHTISRTAFDNQFGAWSITYSYQDSTKTVLINVESLKLEVKTDKLVYYPGENLIGYFTTNYYEPSAAKAETFRINVVDNNGNLLKDFDTIFVKAYQNVTRQEFSIDEFLRNNPIGAYKAVIQYYNVFAETTFSIKDSSRSTSIFVSTDRKSYDPGDAVEVNIIIPEILFPSAVLTVTDPSTNPSSLAIPIKESLTRIKLTDVDTNVGGTYKIQVKYGNYIQTSSFFVTSKPIGDKTNSVNLKLSLEKQNYNPGEILKANFTTDLIITDSITYWFENPLGLTTPKLPLSMLTDSIDIPYLLQTDIQEGPWKMHVEYGGSKTFVFFVVQGEPVSTPDSSLDSTNLAIPKWIKNNAEWWSQSKISDTDFIRGIQFMIQNGIIVIPDLENTEETPPQEIPAWIKNSAGWWADGEISDKEFADGIAYLVKNGIILV